MSEGIPESGFAELLRELKNRSGHSYGTLAKRLHMSTSTLHRYCNGDAVPTDYAPVERLARLCKATPGELVELHRRWVLADAGRGRKGAEPAGVPEAAPEPVAAAQAAPEAVAAAGPEPEPRAAPVPEPEPRAAPVPVPVSVPEPESSPASRWRRSRSLIAGRRTALLAAVTVTALVVGGTVFALNRPSDEGERRDDAKAATATVGSALVQDSAAPGRRSPGARARRPLVRPPLPPPPPHPPRRGTWPPTPPTGSTRGSRRRPRATKRPEQRR
ncbi:helix-turn-helix domain-containing protein [Streptomyces nogalater]